MRRLSAGRARAVEEDRERVQEIRAKRTKKKLQELQRRLAKAKQKARKNKIDFRA